MQDCLAKLCIEQVLNEMEKYEGLYLACYSGVLRTGTEVLRNKLACSGKCSFSLQQTGFAYLPFSDSR